MHDRCVCCPPSLTVLTGPCARNLPVMIGIQHIIGGGVATSSNALVFAGVGGRAGMGPGNGLWIGVPQVSVSLTQAQVGQKQAERGGQAGRQATH